MELLQRIKSKFGFSLLEVILAIGLFAIFAVVMVTASLGARFDFRNSVDRLEARYLIQESVEAVRSIRDYGWENLQEGTFGLSSGSGYWALSGTGDVINEFTRSVTLTKVTPYKFQVEVDIDWTTNEGTNVSLTHTSRLTNWEALFFIADTSDEFNDGYHNSVEETGSGGVVMKQVAGWTNASIAMTEDTGGGGNANEFVVIDNSLYVATGNNTSDEEFLWYDISDISRGSITEIDSVEIGTTTNDLVIHDGYAYIAGNAATEISVVRLSDFTVVASWDIPSGANANGLDVTGTGLIAGTNTSGSSEFYVIDITDPELASILVSGSVEIGADINDLEVSGDYAYLATSDDANEIIVIRLSTLTNVNSVDIAGTADMTSIFVDDEDDEAYFGRVASGQAEFYAYDISTPETTLTLNGSNNSFGDDVADIYIDNGFAYLAVDNTTEEVQVVDLSDFSLDASIDLTGTNAGESIWYYGAHIIGGSTNGSNELQAVASGSNPWVDVSQLDSDGLPGGADAFVSEIDGSYLYILRVDSAQDEFVIYTIAGDGTIGTPTGSLGLTEITNDMFPLGDYAYTVTNGVEFIIIDTSTKSSPSFVTGGTVNLSGGPNGRSVWVNATSSGTTAYVGRNSSAGNQEFYSIDVSTPSSPSQLDSLELGYRVDDVVVNGDYAYLASNNNAAEITVVEISDPNNLTIIQTIDNTGGGNATDLYYDTSDDTLHVALTNGGGNDDYVIYDVSTPGSAVKLGGIDTSFNNLGVTVIASSNAAFLATNETNEELKVVDVTSTSSPTELVSFDTNGVLNDLANNGTYVYSAGTQGAEEVEVFESGTVLSTYVLEAIFSSERFDTGAASTVWGLLDWTETGTGLVQFKTRTASSLANLAAATWVGSDGTTGSYYTSTGSVVQIAPDSTGTQFFQIGAYFTGSGTASNELSNITVQYNQ